MAPIPPQGLSTIVAHRYKSGSWSAGDTALNPFWEAVASCVPPWVAPNLITLVGTLVQLSTLLLGHAYHEGVTPGLTYAVLQLYFAAALVVYQTLDAVDGKQARNTGSSSPLGALFDHGCDALVTNVLVINVLATLGLDPSSGVGFAAYAGALTLFFTAQWEAAATGVLRTNVHGLGVTEAQLFAVAVHVGAACLPRTLFADSSLPVPPAIHRIFHLSSSSSSSSSISTPLLVGCACTMTAALSTLAFIHHVIVTSKKPSALHTLASTLVLLLAAIVEQCVSSREGALGGPSAMLLAYAVCQTHLTTQEIVFSMARQDPPGLLHQAGVMSYPLVSVVSWGMGGPGVSHYARALQWAYAAAVVSLYLHFAVSASLQIKDALGVDVFVLGPRRAAGGQEVGGKLGGAGGVKVERDAAGPAAGAPPASGKASVTTSSTKARPAARTGTTSTAGRATTGERT